METVILVVDDDVEIRKAIRIYLEEEHYLVIEASNGLEALKVLADTTVHLVLLDVMMPELDGTITAFRIREKYNVPILMLTAKSEEADKIQGLQVGADDYLTKPFSPVELVARVKSILRRYLTLGEFATKQASDNILAIDGLVLDKAKKIVTVDGRLVKLTPTEFKIVALLMASPNQVFSIDEIYESVWQEPSFNSENTVAVHIRKIREKIEVVPKEPKYLKVVWGVGYKISQ